MGDRIGRGVLQVREEEGSGEGGDKRGRSGVAGWQGKKGRQGGEFLKSRPRRWYKTEGVWAIWKKYLNVRKRVDARWKRN
jgi:hypothetical protein